MSEALTLDGGEDLGRALERFVSHFAGFEGRMLRSIGVSLVQKSKEHFAQESGPDGTPWLQSRRAKEAGGKTLQDSRILYTSLSYYRDAAGNLITGSPLEYARIHNRGGIIKPRPESGKKALHFGGVIRAQVVIPKREYLGWGPGEIRVVNDVLKDLAKTLSKEGV